ncbi:MAG: cohesin domain-containing protein [Bryobacteraceae bacterium]
MRVSKRLATVLAAAAFLGWTLPALEARTREGDRLYAQGREAEQIRDFDKALDFYERALATDISEVLYQMAYRRARFQAGQSHVDQAQKLREAGELEQALAEFQRAAAIDPASPVAMQEARRTAEMIEREKKLKAAGVQIEDRGRVPGADARREVDEKLASVLSVPELKPLSTLPQNLRINNQPPRVLFETVAKLAGINVIFDPDFTTQGSQTPRSIELANATLEEALNYVAMMTRAFWKPLTANAIFVTQDTPQKRNDYEEQVARIFYISNVSTQQDLTDIVNGIRQMIPSIRMSPVLSQNALVVRGTADQVALTEMMIRNLDRPKAEVVVDVIVMEVNRSRTRDLGATLTSGSTNGLSIAGGLTAKGTGTDDTSSSTGSIAMNRLGRLSSGDFSVTLPGAALQALMSSSNAHILQSPQVRAIDNMKASLRIGERQPYSTGGFQPVFGQVGTGANSLYSSFQYLDVGVNVDITPKVHGTDEVSMHVELEISNIKERINIAGIAQPVVGQRKVIHDIRLREGEVSLLGGLVQEQETRAISGIPGLASIPGLGRLFSTESVTRNDSELLIALVPRVVRTPELDDLSYKGIASGNLNIVRLNYTPRESGAAQPEAAKPSAAPPAQPVVPAPAPAEPAKPVAGAARVVLSPEKVETQPGGTFVLNLQVENARDLFSTPVRLKFDPNVLSLDEVTRGGFLGADGQQVLFTRNILNEAGEASINLSRMPGSTGMSGSGSLVTFAFRVVGKGITVISAPQLSFLDSRAQTALNAAPQATVTIK